MNGKRNIFTCISIVGIGLASFSNSSFAASVTDDSIQNSIPVVNQQVAAAKEMKPFPQQVNYAGVIKPNHVTQESLNASVRSYYDNWKKKYLKNDLSSLPGGYYVKGEITGDADGFKPLGTSEGQGYGMIITVLMAGYDSNAQKYMTDYLKQQELLKALKILI